MFNYFFELRNRLIYIFLTVLFLTLLSFNYKEALLFFLVKPSLFVYQTNLPYFIYTNLTEIFLTYIKLSIIISIYIAIPFIIQHFWKFFKPGLYITEHLYLKTALYIFYFIWIISTLIVHYFLLPQLWQFFSGFDINIFQGPLGLHFEAKLNEYLNFLISMYFNCCFGSQIVISLIIFTLNIGEQNLNFVKNLRSYIYLVSLFIAAIITPPDILSQLLAAFFILVTYEIVIFFLLIKNEYIITIWKQNKKN